MTRYKLANAAVGLCLLMIPASAWAEDFEVQMLNRGDEGTMVFEPAFLQVSPGDTVTFLPTNPSHNAETIPGMMPEGGMMVQGGMNQAVTMTFDIEGVYGIRCAPHYAAGMVALIEVGNGNEVNGEAAAAVRQPGLARRRMGQMFEQLEADN